MSGEAQRHSSRIRLTGRGAVMVMLVVFALGLIGAAWLGWPVLVGASLRHRQRRGRILRQDA